MSQEGDRNLSTEAASRRFEQPRVASPTRALRTCKVCVLVSIVCFGLYLFTADVVFVSSIILGTCSALLGLERAITARRIDSKSSLTETVRVSCGCLQFWIGLSCLLLCVHGFGVRQLVKNLEEVSLTKQDMANLRLIATAVDLYQIKDAAPDSFDALIRKNLITATLLRTHNDPRLSSDTIGDQVYWSFVYCRPPVASTDDPKILLAYEREPWSLCGLRRRQQKCRLVLMADGTDLAMTESEFNDALKADASRRSELLAKTELH